MIKFQYKIIESEVNNMNSDLISLIGIIVSSIISVISIIIAILTLKQNSKMIEESTRPYVTMYGKRVNFGYVKYLLIIKNFGSSSATITNLSSEIDLSKYTLVRNSRPFEHIIGTQLAPQQSIVCNLEIEKIKADKIDFFSFEIEYEGVKKYSEKFIVNFIAETEIANIRRHVDVKKQDSYLTLQQNALKEFIIISDAIQEIGEQML